MHNSPKQPRAFALSFSIPQKNPVQGVFRLYQSKTARSIPFGFHKHKMLPLSLVSFRQKSLLSHRPDSHCPDVCCTPFDLVPLPHITDSTKTRPYPSYNPLISGFYAVCKEKRRITVTPKSVCCERCVAAGGNGELEKWCCGGGGKKVQMPAWSEKLVEMLPAKTKRKRKEPSISFHAVVESNIYNVETKDTRNQQNPLGSKSVML